MHLTYQENWDIIKTRLTLLWDREIYDRPCVAVTAPLDPDRPYIEEKPVSQEDLKRYYTDPEQILARNLERFEKTYFGGDALPCVFPYFGTGGHAKYLNPEVVYQPDTIWIQPAFSDYDGFSFEMEPDNPVFLKELETIRFLAKEGQGRFFVSPPDNCGSYDGIYQLRGTQDFFTDFLEEPEKLRRAGNQMIDLLIDTGNRIFDAIYGNNDCGCVHGWMNTWCPGRQMQLQCDISVMLSPAIFREFLLEELERTSAWLDHAVYHMDGIEQLRHLDYILSVKGIHMLQWVQVTGQPPITCFSEELRKIQAAGKAIVAQVSKKQLEPLLREVTPEGFLFLVTDAASKEEAVEIENYMAKHSFRRRLF